MRTAVVARALGFTIVVVVAVTLNVVREPLVRVLDVRVERDYRRGCAPRAILLAVGPRDLIVGEEGLAPRRIVTTNDLRRLLRGFKEVQPARQVVVVQPADGVSYERLIAVVDAVQAEELMATAIVVDREPAFSVDHWERPPEREDVGYGC